MAFDANDLSPHEHFVVERTRAGEVADFTPMAGPGGAKPPVRAGFIRKLMLGVEPSWGVSLPGVRIRGARLEGALDLTDCVGAGGGGLPALSLEACDIPDAIDISHARLARLSLKASRMTRLVGTEAAIDGEVNLCNVEPLGPPGHETLVVELRGAHVGGDFRARAAKLARSADAADARALNLQGAAIAGSALLDKGFEAFGQVWLLGADIAGVLRCDGARLLNRSDDGAAAALAAESARIAGGVLLRAGFKAEGEVNLAGAAIGGNFEAVGAVIRNEGGAALRLSTATVAGGVRLEGAKIVGRARFDGASIAGNFEARGAEISHPLTPRAESFGTALDGAGLRVGGAMLLHGANMKGQVFLADARIGGYLAFGGGRFINGGDWAIRAPNLRVGGNLTLKLDENGYAPHGQKTVIEGGAKFDRARVEGSFAWLNLELRGPGPDGRKDSVFSFADAQIEGALQAGALLTHQGARVDASGARCAALDDDVKTGWGSESATLALDGFAYGRIEAAAEKRSARLAWLRRSQREHFSSQPFAQLARVYARAGRRDDARRVLLAQHDAQTARASGGPLTWALSSLFGLIAGYGLAPMRIVRALILFFALGVAGVFWMNAQGALVTPDSRACNGAVEPALYALDVALPVVDLGQERACAPGRTARAELPAGMALGDTGWRLFEGVALWRWAHALYAMMGAILAALAILTFSGVMKPKEE